MCDFVGYTKFLSFKKTGFSLNTEILFDLYQPIIGSDATRVYIALYHETSKQSACAGNATDLQLFFQHLGITEGNFKKACSFLEAVGLMQTIAETFKTKENKLFFVIEEPQIFQNFIANQKFRHLLIKNIGQTNYERLEYFYQNNHNFEETTNISSTFEMVFNDEELLKVKSFNFDNLYQNILTSTSISIILSEGCKQIIEAFFKNYTLTIAEIEKCVYASVLRGETNSECVVDETMLKIKLRELVNSSKNVEIFQNIKVNRNSKMFLQYMQQKDIQDVFNDYTNLNSEQYLNAILKVSLSKEEQKIIKILRTEYSLCDYIINMLIDFTLLKSNGKLNINYITKVAKTVNALNLTSLTDIYDYLMNVKTSSSGEVKQGQLSKIDWDELPQ